MPKVNNPATIELNPDWQAEAGHCGSCSFFKRRASGVHDPDTHGICQFVLPGFMARKVDISTAMNRDAVWEVDPRTVQDRDSCDLYHSTGKQYVQKKYWSAP